MRSTEKRGAIVPGSNCRVESSRDTSYTSAFGERLEISNNLDFFSHFYTKSYVIFSGPHIIGNIAGCHLLSVWHSIPCKINASCSFPRILVQ